jgi:hypothetical protein
MRFDLIKKGTLVTASLAALAASAVASAWTPPSFPRIGGIQIGSPFNYDNPNYQAQLAKQSVMVLSNYPGMKPNGVPMQTALSQIKQRNPNALIFIYVNANQLRADQSLTSASWGPYRATINKNRWWLYNDKGMSSFVNAGFGTAGDNEINMTLFTPKDSSGNTAIDWMTRFFVDTYAKNTPAIDGLFMDNVFWRPYIDGDWNRDGVIDSQNNPTVQSWMRQGYARYFSLVKTLMPGKYQMGNIGDWGAPNANLTEYQGMANGGVMEGYIGKSWSVETWGGWAAALAQYRKVMGALAAPKIGIFNQWGNSTDYQAMRYGLGTCLLDDGYYAFTDNTAQYYGVVWFDEYDHSLGSGSTKPTAAWQKGVWRRDFDNGIVLVNPKGNGAQTVTLEQPFVKIKGSQDPVTNNGQTVTTVTLKDRDGIILMRTKSVTRPGTPSGFAVEH